MTNSGMAGVFSRALVSPKIQPCECVTNHTTVTPIDELHYGRTHGTKVAETSTFLRIPKFIQAILTLIICTILLATTLCIIGRIRRRFSKKKHEYDVNVIVEPPPNDTEAGPPLQDNRNNLQGAPTSTTNHLKVPVVKFVRRLSGPFGDDAIAFIRESYKKPTRAYSKETGRK